MMQSMTISTLLTQQRQFFATGTTLPVTFRIAQLQQLKSLLQTHEAEIAEALKKDLNKNAMEAVFIEILLVIKEIDVVMKRLKKWARPQKVSTPFFLWPGHSEIQFEPYGSVLIIGPWNYPFMLIMSPLIGAISAGNCVIVKPSEIAVHTENLIARLINQYFPPHYVAAVTGGPEQVTQLLQEKFDYIFFTGSAQIGKIIMEAAAKQLTPVTLELGGKSPCIVTESADLDFAARRIAWAKTLNAGQVCITPDYLYVHHSQKEALVAKLRHALRQFYSDHPEKSADYCRIINKKHFERLTKLLQKGNILLGGETDESQLYISPTLIDGISWDDSIMQDEIFGPILPILTYDQLDDVIHTIRSQPKPLALYLFTKNKETERKIFGQLSFGGGCMNDCVVHIANPFLPFGGVGQSGIGCYHGKYSFQTFSHRKSIYKKRISIESTLEYPPYSQRKLWWIRKLLKI